MNTKHTPGPWKADEHGLHIWGISVGGCRMELSDHLIADIRGWGHLQYLPDGIRIQKANARLIAAAPDLLASLIEITSVLDALLMVKSEPEEGSIGGRARAAIAKATGHGE